MHPPRLAGKGYRLTGTSLYRIVRRLGEQVGLKVRPHGLRHTAITEACKLAQAKGMGLEEVLDFSRHRDVKVLMVYRDRERNVQGQLATLVAAGVEGDQSEGPCVGKRETGSVACDSQNEDSGMSVRGPSSEKPTDCQLGSRRRGEASVEMTAQDILSLAVTCRPKRLAPRYVGMWRNKEPRRPACHARRTLRANSGGQPPGSREAPETLGGSIHDTWAACLIRSRLPVSAPFQAKVMSLVAGGWYARRRCQRVVAADLRGRPTSW